MTEGQSAKRSNTSCSGLHLYIALTLLTVLGTYRGLWDHVQWLSAEIQLDDPQWICLLFLKEKEQHLSKTVRLGVDCQVHICYIFLTLYCYLTPSFISLRTHCTPSSWAGPMKWYCCFLTDKSRKGICTLWQRALMTSLLCWTCPVFVCVYKDLAFINEINPFFFGKMLWTEHQSVSDSMFRNVRM